MGSVNKDINLNFNNQQVENTVQSLMEQVPKPVVQGGNLIIYSAIGGGFALLVVVFVIVCMVFRKKKKDMHSVAIVKPKITGRQDTQPNNEDPRMGMRCTTPVTPVPVSFAPIDFLNIPGKDNLNLMIPPRSANQSHAPTGYTSHAHSVHNKNSDEWDDNLELDLTNYEKRSKNKKSSDSIDGYLEDIESVPRHLKMNYLQNFKAFDKLQNK